MRKMIFSAVKSFVAANWRSGNGFVAMAFSRAVMVISYISLSLYCGFSVLKEGF
jgi:formate hydrogenlyase subunit 4